MKKLIIILLLFCSSAFSAPFTNKVVNIITIYETNSPVLIGYYAEIGVRMATNSSPQAFTHSLWNYNPANSVASIRNTAPDGFARFTLKEYGGTDQSFIGSGVGGSNIVIHAAGVLDSYIQLTGFGGSAGNEIFFNTLATTNTKEFVVGTRMTALTNQATVYKVGPTEGFTGSITNVGPDLGSSNVMVYATGILTNKFTIP